MAKRFGGEDQNEDFYDDPTKHDTILKKKSSRSEAITLKWQSN